MPEVHEQLIDQVRAAFEPGATTATKQAAAQACRMMLAVLEPTAAAASSAPSSASSAPSSASSAPSSASSAPAAGANAPDPLGALLEGIISRYRHLLPDDPTRPPMPIPIIAIPPNFFGKAT